MDSQFYAPSINCLLALRGTSWNILVHQIRRWHRGEKFLIFRFCLHGGDRFLLYAISDLAALDLGPIRFTRFPVFTAEIGLRFQSKEYGLIINGGAHIHSHFREKYCRHG